MDVWMQLVITGGAVVTALFFTIRYSIKETNKGKNEFLNFLKSSQTQQLDYYENKNGTIERMSKSFVASINKNSRAVDKLASKIKQ